MIKVCAARVVHDVIDSGGPDEAGPSKLLALSS
jgi:hypothetical protein